MRQRVQAGTDPGKWQRSQGDGAIEPFGNQVRVVGSRRQLDLTTEHHRGAFRPTGCVGDRIMHPQLYARGSVIRREVQPAV